MAKRKIKKYKIKKVKQVNVKLVVNKDPIADILTERGETYGTFEDNAEMTQKVKDIYRASPGWAKLSYTQRETLDMNAHKTSRIMNGDPNFKDSWTDIIGYTKLVEQKL